MTSPDPSLPPMTPSSPVPELTTLVASLLRAILALLAGVGISVGSYSDSTLTIVAGALIGIATAAWGIYSHIRAAIRDHEGSVASAARGEPLRPT